MMPPSHATCHADPARSPGLQPSRVAGRDLPWGWLAALLACLSLIYLLVGDAWPVEAAVALGLLAAKFAEDEREPWS